MLDKELPENVIGSDTRVPVEVGIEGYLSGDVHRALIPDVAAANEPVHRHFRVILAVSADLLHDVGGLSEHETVRLHDAEGRAQGSWGIDPGATIGGRTAPICKVLIGGGHMK